MDINAYLEQQTNSFLNGILIWGILWLIVIIAIWTGIIILICKYLAKQISIKFDYDYLAQRIAEETCKRMLIIEKQKKEARKIEKPEDQGYQKVFENLDESTNA